MWLIIFAFGLVFLIWHINKRLDERRVRKAEYELVMSRRQEESQRLFDAGQITASQKFLMLNGHTLEQIRKRKQQADGGDAMRAVQSPAVNADYDQSSSNAAFWEQMEEQRRNEAYRRREDEIEQQWRDDDNRRQAEARQREDDYWAQRQRDEY